MIDPGARARQIISEETMLVRLAQSEQMREFFIQVWMQNPGLANQGGIKVKALMTRLEDDASQALPQKKLSMTERARQRGISLVELIMFIVIVSAALAGLLLVMNVTEKGSSDPLIRKQALAAAESLLEEIELQDFNSTNGATVTVSQANRASQYHIVRNYAGFATAGIYTVDGITPITGLANYNITSVTVTPATLGSITSGSGNAVLITVTVTDPQGNTMQVSGYRTAY